MQVHTLLWRGLLGFFLSLTFSHAIFRPGWRLQKHHGYVKTLAGTTQLDPRYGPFYFNQPIDHFTANSRTFKQRFWANTDWYEPGGPVILYNAGETAADERSAYVTNSSMALLARDLRGIIIVMEHRSYGRSQPGTDYSVKYLKTLTTAQALEDMANIIRTVKLPNLEGELPPPPATRWIVYGGSYSGNLAAWMREKYPDLVFAAVASSAPVELRYNFYQYFQAVQQYAPRHCVHAIQMVMQYVDHILYGPFESGKRRLRRRFGVEELEHDDDFAELLTYPLGLWQEMSPDANPFQDEFCAIFDNASSFHGYLDAYSNYIKGAVKKACGDQPINECLDTHDPQSPMYHDLKSESRAWFWQTCLEMAYWQTAPPLWYPTIVSRKLTTTWYQRQCPFMFGDAVPEVPEWRRMNKDYGGWDVCLSRTFWVDGEWDPWRTLSVQSDNAPSRSHCKEDAYYVVLPKAVHHWDFFISENLDPSIKIAQRKIKQALVKWLIEAQTEVHATQTPTLLYQATIKK